MDKYIMDITLGDQDYIAPLGFEVMPEIKREEKGDPCHLIASDSKRWNVSKEVEDFLFIRLIWLHPHHIAARINFSPNKKKKKLFKLCSPPYSSLKP